MGIHHKKHNLFKNTGQTDPPPGPPENTWEGILAKIETRVGSHSFSTWFKPTRFLGEDASSLAVRVPNTWFAEWLRTNYSGLIQDALRDLHKPGLTVEFRPEVTDPPPQSATRPGEGRPPVSGSRLNPKYTFDTFVVSSCNQFAHAAAMAVAEQPSRAYNPLYVYGGVGLGKTHLMQAIGNRIVSQGQQRMRYISSESFMNELINAIRFEKTFEFKERYRNVDVLLIDDIQFSGGQGADPGGVLPHLQRAVRFPETDRYHQRRTPAGDSDPRGAAAVAIRMGPDRGHAAPGPRDKDRHPAQEDRAGPLCPARRCGAVHCVELRLEHSRVGGCYQQGRGLCLDGRPRDLARSGQADAPRHDADRITGGHGGQHPQAGRQLLQPPRQPAQDQEQQPADRFPRGRSRCTSASS